MALLAAVTGCGGGDGSGREPERVVPPVDVSAAHAEVMGTVVTVTWRTDEPATGYVTFGADGELDRSTEPSEPTTEHSALLVGLPPDHPVDFQVVSEGATSDILTVTTGQLPIDPPEFTVEGEGNDQFVALTHIEGGRVRPMVLDPRGRVVWIWEDMRDLSVFRVMPMADGSGILYAATVDGARPHEGSVLVRVSWDGATEEVTEVPWLAHDMVELPDGSVVSTAFEFRDELEGNKLVHITRDGEVTDIWSAWDCFDPEEHPSIDPPQGWTHANALDYDEATDALIIGLRNLGTITSVDRSTGTCNWSLGGSPGTVSIDGPRFLHQHQFDLFDGGLVVFDNDGAPGNESRVLELDFDPEAGTATHVRTIAADPPLYSFILGDAHRLDDGDTLVVWSVPSTIDRIGPDGTRRWRAATEAGVLAFAHLSPVLP